MKIGIVGPAKRAVAWEKHLAGHPSVSEVIIAADLNKAGELTACLLLNNNPDEALEAIKKGFHTFFISKLPTKLSTVKKLYHASEEANVQLQFSHWPTFAPASQWTALKIPNPSFIQIVREVNHTTFLENELTLNAMIIDELAYCLKNIDSSIYQINSKNSGLGNRSIANQTMISFDNRATAAIYINIASSNHSHKRFISNTDFSIECDAETQQLRIGRNQEKNHLFFDRKEFNTSTAAEQSVIKFLKAIQLKKPTAYNGYDLLRLSKTLKKIDL